MAKASRLIKKFLWAWYKERYEKPIQTLTASTHLIFESFQGGPCGVLSALQSLILKNLLFGSEDFDDDRDGRRLSLVTASPANGDIPNLDDNSVIASLSAKRMIALVAAIVEILWKCASNSQPPTPIQISICLAGSFNVTSPTPEVYIMSTLDELKKYVQIGRASCRERV